MRTLLFCTTALVLPGCAQNGATPSPKAANMQLTLDSGETISYQGQIRPRFMPIQYPADVQLTNTDNAADVCATEKPMRQTSDNTGTGVVHCSSTGWKMPIHVSPYPVNAGSATGAVLDAAGARIGSYTISWQNAS